MKVVIRYNNSLTKIKVFHLKKNISYITVFCILRIKNFMMLNDYITTKPQKNAVFHSNLLAKIKT